MRPVALISGLYFNSKQLNEQASSGRLGTAMISSIEYLGGAFMLTDISFFIISYDSTGSEQSTIMQYFPNYRPTVTDKSIIGCNVLSATTLAVTLK